MSYRDNIKAILAANFIGFDKEYLDAVCKKICEIQPTEKSYEDGLNEAWECARKLILIKREGGLSMEEIEKIFGDTTCRANILRAYTASETIAKIKEYEDKHIDNEIKLWDEVIIKKSSYGYAGCKGVVTNILRYDLVEVMVNYGTVYNYDTETIQKTGKSYPELANILNQLKATKETKNVQLLS